jgi:hypothetical protein
MIDGWGWTSSYFKNSSMARGLLKICISGLTSSGILTEEKVKLIFVLFPLLYT